MRPHLYSEETLKLAAGSYVDIMRRYFMERALQAEYEVIDMQPIFIDHFRLYGRHFDSMPVDAHWNSLGHERFFEAMRGSRVVRKMEGGG